MSDAPFHPGRPHTLNVKGDGVFAAFSGTYNLDLAVPKSPLWRRTGLGNVEISQEGSAPFYTWLLTSESEKKLSFEGVEPLGNWDDGLVVSAVLVAPSVLALLAFPCPKMSYNEYLTGGAGKRDLAEGRSFASLLTRSDLVFLHTEEHEQIPAIYRQMPGARYCLLYSHGNSEDLGTLFPYIDYMAESIGVNVFAYDYVGYSLSRLEGHVPSEEGCYRAVQAAWRYLTQIVPAEMVILYGRSIGSGPTVEIACQQCASQCAGIILESPIASGARALAGSIGSLAWFADIFINYDKVGKICRPITIMHGIADTIVSVGNGKELFEKCQKPWRWTPLWIEGCGHNDMPRDVCTDHVISFMASLAPESKFNSASQTDTSRLAFEQEQEDFDSPTQVKTAPSMEDCSVM